jgi:hypothetical protein
VPAWIIITAADLDEARVAELVAALRQEALGVGQPDPMPGIIQKIVDEVRSCIGFCHSTRLDVDPAKIPANLKELVVQKVIRVLKARLLQPQTDDEKAEEATYQKRLLLLTQCAWPVDTTDTPLGVATVQPQGSVEIASAGKRYATQEGLRGL